MNPSPTPQNIIYTGGGTVFNAPVYAENGVVIGHDQINNYVVRVFGPTALAHRDVTAIEKPYLPDRPFEPAEHELFTTRTAEVEAILRHYYDASSQTIVIYGPADVGKTSLLAAGVLPRLQSQGTSILHLKDYAHASPFIRAWLAGTAAAHDIAFPADAPVAALAQTIVTSLPINLVLMLDQFERAFLPDITDGERVALRRDLTEMMQALDHPHLYVLIAIREDEQHRLEKTWGDNLPGLRRDPVYLKRLTRSKARQAIIVPLQKLELRHPFEPSVIDGRLLPELDDLTPDERDDILPSDLQIVCAQLYEYGCTHEVLTIDEAQYLEASGHKGVEKLIDMHFEQLLRRVARPQMARAILTHMLDPAQAFWVTPAQLPIEAKPADVATTLSEMEKADLLIWRWANGERSYAFARDSIRSAARRAVGPEARRQQQARDEISYAWRAWIAYDELAGQAQLRRAARAGGETVSPERAILMLRSALAAGTTLAPWIEQLTQPDAVRLVRQLEEISPPDAPLTRLSTPCVKIVDLLNLQQVSPVKRTEPTEFGPIAWSAATHPDAICTEATLLTLRAAYDGKTCRRRVLAAVTKANMGTWRRAALSGMLLEIESATDPIWPDADPGGLLLEAAPDDVSVGWRTLAGDRLATYGWRVRRRLGRQWQRVARLSLWGAIGAGILLGIYRGLTASSAGLTPGFQLAVNLWWGILLGLALTGSMLLADVLLWEKTAVHKKTQSYTPLIRSTLFGALGFAIVHLLIAMSRGRFALTGKVDQAIGGLLVGISLSAMLVDLLPKPRRPITPLPLRLAVVALAAVAGKLLAWQIGSGRSLVVAVRGENYRTYLEQVVRRWWPNLIEQGVPWYRPLGYVDAVVVCCLLYIGILLGTRWLARLQLGDGAPPSDE